MTYEMTSTSDVEAVVDEPIIAYTERHTVDPMTCEEGVLREEWSLVPFHWSDPEHLAARMYHSHPILVLRHRYIRRGTVESWIIFGCYVDDREPFQDIPDNAVAVDPRLAKLQADRAEYRRQREAEAEQQRMEAIERTEKRRHAADSQATFNRLRMGKNEQGRELAERFMAFTDRWRDNAEQLNRWREDPEFMAAYDKVMDSVTVPKKRVAIREFLARYGA